MKLTKQEFDKKYAINDLTNIEIFDTIFYLFEKVTELEALQNRSCNNCKNSSFEVKFGELEFNGCFLVSNGNVCKWESK